jgi:undecaprenyl-diphosphatase
MRTWWGTQAPAPRVPWFPRRWGPILWWLTLLAFVLLAVLVVSGASQSWDDTVARWAYSTRTDPLTRLAEGISSAGTFPWIMLVAGGTCVLVDRWLKSPWRSVIRVAAVLCIDVVVVAAIKAAVDRPRPAPDMRLAIVQTTSFPSGHVTATTAAACVLVLTVVAATTSRRTHVAAMGVALVAIVAMGWSRVYLGVHYLTDVVAGAVLGLWLALSTAWLLDSLDILRRVRADSSSLREVTRSEPPAAASPGP